MRARVELETASDCFCILTERGEGEGRGDAYKGGGERQENNEILSSLSRKVNMSNSIHNLSLSAQEL